MTLVTSVSAGRYAAAVPRYSAQTHRRLRNRSFLATLTLVCTLFWATQSHAAITFVQRNYAIPQSPQSSVSVSFPAAQTAGDLNVVVVGWNDTTAAVISVSDSQGNSYARAV